MLCSNSVPPLLPPQTHISHQFPPFHQMSPFYFHATNIQLPFTFLPYLRYLFLPSHSPLSIFMACIHTCTYHRDARTYHIHPQIYTHIHIHTERFHIYYRLFQETKQAVSVFLHLNFFI